MHVESFSVIWVTVDGFIAYASSLNQKVFVPNVPLHYNPLMALSVHKNVMSLIKCDKERINELLNLVSAECDQVNEPVCLGLCVCLRLWGVGGGVVG